ncbi:40S ribosomal protein S12 [Neocallimastix sp. 'constans']
MSDEEDAPVQVYAMTVGEALQEVFKEAIIHGCLAKGLRESVKALERREASLCVLVETCRIKEYVKLVEALCKEHCVNLIKIPSYKKLGVWAGLCRFNRRGEPYKIVYTSCAVIKNYGDSAAMNVILRQFNEQ